LCLNLFFYLKKSGPKKIFEKKKKTSRKKLNLIMNVRYFRLRHDLLTPL